MTWCVTSITLFFVVNESITCTTTNFGLLEPQKRPGNYVKLEKAYLKFTVI